LPRFVVQTRDTLGFEAFDPIVDTDMAHGHKDTK